MENSLCCYNKSFLPLIAGILGLLSTFRRKRSSAVPGPYFSGDSLLDPCPLAHGSPVGECGISCREQPASFEPVHGSVSSPEGLWTVSHPRCCHSPPPLALVASCPRDLMCLWAQRAAQPSRLASSFCICVLHYVTDWDLGSGGFRFGAQMPHLQDGDGAPASGESEVPLRLCSRAGPGCRSPHRPGEETGGKPACPVAYSASQGERLGALRCKRSQ